MTISRAGEYLRSLLGELRKPSGRLGFLFSPSSEQRSIVKFISARCDEIDRTIAHALSEIGLSREDSTRLTADVVTGRVDVRWAAMEGLVDKDFNNDNRELCDVDGSPAQHLS